MITPLKIQDLVGDVIHAHPSAHLEFDPLPSGVCFVWVALFNRDFVLEFNPKQGTGVSENFPDTPPFVGHNEVYNSLDEAIARFKGLLVEAARASDSAPMVLHDKKS